MTAIELALVGKKHGMAKLRDAASGCAVSMDVLLTLLEAVDAVFEPSKPIWSATVAAEKNCPDREVRWDRVIYLLQQAML